MVDVAAVKAALEEVKGIAVEVQNSVDAAATSLSAEITRVEALIAAGQASPQDLQDLLDGLTATKASLTAADTSADAIKAAADAERP